MEYLHDAVERVQRLEQGLADAEDQDRQALGEALVDRTKPPASKAEKARSDLTEAKAEVDALQYAAERAAQVLDAMPAERRGDWLPKARTGFLAARERYEELLNLLAEAREQLQAEAGLLSFLSGSAIHMTPQVRVHTSGVEGLHSDVAFNDVLDALRFELADLDFAEIRGTKV